MFAMYKFAGFVHIGGEGDRMLLELGPDGSMSAFSHATVLANW
jgi:hypothetical protein